MRPSNGGRVRPLRQLQKGNPLSEVPVVVGVFNTSPDTVELLRIVLEQQGFIVVAAYTYELRDGRVDIEALVRQHRLGAIVYDIAPPYDRNWRLLEHMRTMPALKDINFVIPSTNPARVHAAVSTDQELLEIVGKPYDLQLIVDAVKQAVNRR